MNHDLTHCDAQYYIYDKHGEYKERFCSKRTKCKRYNAYLDLKGDESFPVSFMSAKICVTKRHNLYMEEIQ